MKLKNIILYSALAFLSVSCGSEEGQVSSGYGTLDIQVLPDYEVMPVVRSVQESTANSDVPTVEDFSLKLTSKTGDYTRLWESIDRFKPNTKIPIGTYTVSAFYGDLNTEDFEMPYYYGENEVTVLDHENTPVTINCTLANVKVTVEYSEAFKNYFADWSTTIQSTGGKYIEFAKDENRAAYVKPGRIKIQTRLKKQNGVESTFEPAAIENAVGRHHYRIKLDISDNIGNAQVTISFDESTETQPVRIEVSDEVMNAPAPSFLPTGFESGVTVEAKEFSYATNKDVNLSITAKGGLAGCTLTTTSASLLAQGWPQEVDLLNLNDEQNNQLTQLGLKFKGFNAPGNKMGFIDFTEVFTHLNVTESGDTHAFVVSARDEAGKVSNSPITLSVKSLPIIFNLQPITDIYVGSTSITIPVQFNGSNIDHVKFSYFDEEDQPIEAPATTVSQSGETYQVKLRVNVANKPLKIEGSFGNGTKVESITIPVKTPPFTISAEAYDIWARKASIKLTATDSQYQEAVEKYVSLYINNTGSWRKLTTTGDAEMRAFTGLIPNTQYQLRGTCNDGLDNTNYCNTYTLRTEAATIVPNGDFENLVETINISSMNHGGRWSHKVGNRTYLCTSTYVIKEPSNWASVNAKTHNPNAANQMTWFVTPSTFNTTL